MGQNLLIMWFFRDDHQPWGSLGVQGFDPHPYSLFAVDVPLNPLSGECRELWTELWWEHVGTNPNCMIYLRGILFRGQLFNDPCLLSAKRLVPESTFSQRSTCASSWPCVAQTQPNPSEIHRFVGDMAMVLRSLVLASRCDPPATLLGVENDGWC